MSDLDFSEEIFSDSRLRSLGGSTIFERGRSYFLQGRVELISLEGTRAHLHVLGSFEYCVDILIDYGDFYAECICPHAESGYFCKHIVAACLALRGHFRESTAGRWKLRIQTALSAVPSILASSRRPDEFLLLFSLQHSYSYWTLNPLILPRRSIPDALWSPDNPADPQEIVEILEHNRWLAEKVRRPRRSLDRSDCLNCGADLVTIANVILGSERTSSTSYYYAYKPPVAEQLALLMGKDAPVFLGTTHTPLERRLIMPPEEASLELEIRRPQDGGAQLRTLLRAGELLTPLQAGQYGLITRDPPWLLSGEYLLRLAKDGAADFAEVMLQSPEIHVPAADETEFLEEFLVPLASHVPVRGDQIHWEQIEAGSFKKRLYLSEEAGVLAARLRFLYEDYELAYDPDLPEVSVRRKKDGSWTLVRISRDPRSEERIYRSISSARYGLKYGRGSADPDSFLLRARVDPIDFLLTKIPNLLADGFEIFGEDELKTARVNRNRPTISLNVTTGIDWFDIQAEVRFGDVSVSLTEIRRALRRKKRYVKLADETIGEIPASWISKYQHLFGLGEQNEQGARFSSHHVTLLEQLLQEADNSAADQAYHDRLQKLKSFSGIAEMPLTENFAGALRPYQKAGYDWLHFLRQYHFGGCLADDMGLGKTVQVLAFLRSLRDANGHQPADLVVVPRSLLVNWERETARFTPETRVMRHFGPDRIKKDPSFDGADLVITTYGTMRRDIQALRKYRFNYVILDESQSIKNPLSQTARAARLLHSEHRLALTGTPVENNTFELWSQFAFLNPGMLGNLEYFKRSFAGPIERMNDDTALALLQKMVFPFILRRTKSQVAPELPPRTERVIISDMEPAQRKYYERTREYYRGLLLGMIEAEGLQNSRMKILEGLLRLRQISNHPKLVDEKFRGKSAKMELLLEHLESLRERGHKVLVFSQFVRMLRLVRGDLDRKDIPYLYLDGRTRKRQQRVDEFQKNGEIPFFLISLKAGGLGLNLTAADYVIHIDPWWNPAVEMQASDRSHRLGQDKPVFIYKLIARDTVEEKILQLQEKKKSLVEQLITSDSSFFKDISREDIEVLFS